MWPDAIFDLARYQWHPFATPMVAAATVGLLVAFALLIREQWVLESVLFFVIAFFAAVWLYSFTWMYCARDAQTALWWAKAAYLGVPFLPAAVYHFSMRVLKIEGRHGQAAVRLFWALGALFSALIVGTDLFIPDVYRYSWGYYPHYSSASVFYMAYFFGVLGAMLFHYYRQTRTGDRQSLYRQRAEAFFLSFLILTTGSVDYFPKYGVEIYPFGFVSVFCFLALASRTIWIYRFTDITPAFAAQQILETMNEPLVVCDDRGMIKIVNKAFCAAYGYSQEEMTGRPMGYLLAADDSQKVEFAMALCRNLTRDAEFPFRAKDGRVISVCVSASPLKDGRGFLQGCVAVCRDVTERKEIERRMWEMTRTLEKSVKERTSELESKVHELEWLNEIMMGREERILELKELLDKRRNGAAKENA